MAKKKITGRSCNAIWDSLSDILEEPGTKIPAGLRKKAIKAIQRANTEAHKLKLRGCR